METTPCSIILTPTLCLTDTRTRRKEAKTENVIKGIIVRQVFLGGTRDYMVEVGGTQLRVVAPAEQNIAQGAAVWLCLPPERCRVLVG